jgi:protein-disulfide isomerase
MAAITKFVPGLIFALAALFAVPAIAQMDINKPATDLPENSMGNKNAPVTIIEYSSMSCPHCAAYHKEVLPKLKEKYIDTGKVHYILREFPLNDSAFAAAVVARCVDPAHYFNFIDFLYKRQEDWAFGEDVLTPLKNLSKQAGLSEEKFNECLNNKELAAKILKIREQGSKLGVNATPSFFVNGKPIKGGVSMEKLEAAMKPYLGSS